MCPLPHPVLSTGRGLCTPGKGTRASRGGELGVLSTRDSWGLILLYQQSPYNSPGVRNRGMGWDWDCLQIMRKGCFLFASSLQVSHSSYRWNTNIVLLMKTMAPHLRPTNNSKKPELLVQSGSALLAPRPAHSAIRFLVPSHPTSGQLHQYLGQFFLCGYLGLNLHAGQVGITSPA